MTESAKAKVVATLNVTNHGHAFTKPTVAGYSLSAGDYDLVTLTDHEAALADLAEEVHKWHWHAESVSEWGRQNLARAEAAEAKHATLLTGLEALAGEWEEKVRSQLGYGPSGGSTLLCAGELKERIRTLASAGLEGKQTPKTNEEERI